MRTLPPIHLIVYDFDGVMTDNRVLVFQDGTEGVIVHRGDGLGIGMIRKMEIPQMILSTETNDVVLARARKLRLEAIHGCDDKRVALLAWCKQRAIELKHVLFIGNDLNDLEVMEVVGYRVAPQDAHPEVLAIADHVTAAPGGYGVIREFADFLKQHISS